MGYKFGDISKAITNALSDFASMFGLNIPKLSGETDLFKWLGNIQQNLGDLPAVAAAKIGQLERKLEGLQMTPIVGRLKTIVTEARRRASNQYDKARQLQAKAELAETTSKGLAEEISNMSATDVVGARGTSAKQRMDDSIHTAVNAYKEIANLGSDIPSISK